MRELETMELKLQRIFNKKGAQVWTGDFNSLTREDYNDEDWDKITRVRLQHNWEPPQTEVNRNFFKQW